MANNDRLIASANDSRQRRSDVWFDTDDFVSSHGRMPRGRGSWAFDFGQGPEFCPGSVTYGEAKKWATDRALALGVDRVEVCS